MNKNISKDALILRSKFLRTVRNYFYENYFYEIDSPCFKKNPSMEPYLSHFRAESNNNSQNGYLISSPEYSLKHVLSLGLDRIYEISHCFRAEEINSPIHTAEFLMLEFYVVGFCLEDLILFCKKFCKYLNDHFLSFSFNSDKVIIRSVLEQFQKLFNKGYSRKELNFLIIENNLYFGDLNTLNYEDAFFLVFLNLIEPNLENEFVFLYDYPEELASLSKVENSVAKRFELYWNRVELANAFFELNDYEEQIRRFKKEQRLRKKLNKPIVNIDLDFEQSLKSGFPDSSGIAIGLDRLFMLILKQKSLKNISPYFGQINEK